MKHNRTIQLVITIGTGIFLSLFLLSPASAQKADFCNLQGAVFFTDNRAMADFSIYIEETEAFADLNVYMEDVSAYANDAGHWYQEAIESFANFYIYIEKEQSMADFSIYYVDNPTWAGCQ